MGATPNPNDKEVTVTYKASDSPPFSFSPDGGDVTLTGPGVITFSKGAGSDAFTFYDIEVTPQGFTPAHNDFVSSVQPDTLRLNDSDADPGTYNYCVKITVNGQVVTSDPQIYNRQT